MSWKVMVSVLFLTLPTACSQSTENGGEPSGAGATGAAASPNAGAPVGGSADPNQGLINGGSVGGSLASAPDGSCAATHATGERVVTHRTVQVPVTVTKAEPIALYLMEDRSGSMKDTPGGASSDKWSQAVTAVNAFVNTPASNGVDVALGLFPLSGGTCAGGAYDTPVVPVKRILDPVLSQAVADALNANAPGGGGGRGGGAGSSGTPIEGALRGAVSFCSQYQANSPTGEKCVAVLITDGAPNGCAEDTATLTGIAANGYAQAGIRTFAIGMDGADFGLLDAIAVAGHSDCTPNVAGSEACNVTGGVTSFNDALALIRNSVTTVSTTTEVQDVVETSRLPCDFTIPSPPPGQVFDRGKVNVNFVHGTSEAILQVPSAGDCAKLADRGWYYDDPNNPTRIQLCPGTCDDVKALSGDGGSASAEGAPRIDILLGCASNRGIIR